MAASPPSSGPATSRWIALEAFVSNLGRSIARRGLMAPGDAITSLGINGESFTGGGTSAATPFVTGGLALLLSMFPEAHAAEAKSATTRADVRRAAIVPPLLDAWSSYQVMLKRHRTWSHACAEENLGRKT